MNIKKIVYDKYENDYGFIEDQIKDHTHEIITNIGNKNIVRNRKLEINTWGIKKNTTIDCDIIFDCSLFSAKCDVDIKNLTGLDEIIQQSIMNHPKFDLIIEMILSEIEVNDYKKIGFVCNYGKHRSVGWAELIKKLYYNESIITHNNL
jgi:RNase adaptor protein for sRNA GlmZ degradation